MRGINICKTLHLACKYCYVYRSHSHLKGRIDYSVQSMHLGGDDGIPEPHKNSASFNVVFGKLTNFSNVQFPCLETKSNKISHIELLQRFSDEYYVEKVKQNT